MQRIGAGTAMNIMRAIGPFTSFDRGNTNPSTNVTIENTNASANWSASAGRSVKAAQIAIMGEGMRAASTDMDAKVMATTIEAVSSVRRGAVLLAACSLLLAPYIAAPAADNEPHQSSISIQAKAFGAAVKRDAKAVGARCKEGAHRIAVAAKSVGQQITTAAKRGAAGTRAAFRGEPVKTAP